MKKTLRLLSLALVLVMTVALLASCGGPNKNPEKAKEALEDAGYTVTLVDSALGFEGIEKYLTAFKMSEDMSDMEMITIYYFEDSAAAKDAWEDIQKEAEELDEEDLVIKKSGKMIYAGTKEAVKAAK